MTEEEWRNCTPKGSRHCPRACRYNRRVETTAHGARRPAARSNRQRGAALTKLRCGELDDGPTAWCLGRRCSDQHRGGFRHGSSDRGFLYGQTAAGRCRPAQPIRTRRGPTQAMTSGAHASARIQF
jgi:hypothetical protein